MAQLRQDYEQFVERDTVVIAVGPDTQQSFKDYWTENEIPFIGLADPLNEVAKRYDQEVNLFKLGRIPAQMVIDKHGKARFVHYSNSMSDIPSNQDILNFLDGLDP